MSTVSSSWLPSTCETSTKEPNDGPWKGLRPWSFYSLRTGWESWDCSVQRGEGSQGTSPICANIWRESVEEMAPGLFQYFPVTGQDTTSMNSASRGGTTWAPSNTFSLWGWPSTGMGCPGRQWKKRKKKEEKNEPKEICLKNGSDCP